MCVWGVLSQLKIQLGCTVCPPHLLLSSTVVEIGINTKTTQSDTNTKPNKKNL